MHKRNLLILAILIIPIFIGIGWLTTLLGVFNKEEKNQPFKLYYADNISPSHQLAIDEFNRLHAGNI